MNARKPIVVGIAAALMSVGMGSTAAMTGTQDASTAAAAAFEGAQGTYKSVNPSRVLDTRTGLGAPQSVVGAGKEISLLAVGRGGVPGGVTAVVLNLTAVGPSTNTFLTAYPSGTTRPSTSSLNVAARTNRANLVTVPVGADGRVRIYNSSGTTHILADVMGYYHGQVAPATGLGSQYFTMDPERWYDSREDGGAYASGDSVALWGDFGAANSIITAFAANITVLQGTQAGYVAAGPTPTPSISSVNYGRNQVIANMSVVPTRLEDGLPTFHVVNKGPGAVQIIVDVVGVYTQGEAEGLRFRSLTPRRIMDTRTGIGGPATPIGPNEERQQFAPETVAGIDTYALVANTTIAGPTTATYVTAFNNDLARPGVSNLNAAQGETSANSTFVPVGAGNLFRVHNAGGSAPVIMDVTGSFELYPSTAAPAQRADGSRSDAGRLASSEHGGARR